MTGNWDKAEGRKWEGLTVTGNGGRRRYAVQCADTSKGGWRVAGAGDVQVGGALYRERSWGAGTNIDRYKIMT